MNSQNKNKLFLDEFKNAWKLFIENLKEEYKLDFEEQITLKLKKTEFCELDLR